MFTRTFRLEVTMNPHLLRQHFSYCFAVFVSLLAADANRTTSAEPKTQLLVQLPASCPTPDGMAIDAEGNLVVACPNFGDPSREPA